MLTNGHGLTATAIARAKPPTPPKGRERNRDFRQLVVLEAEHTIQSNGAYLGGKGLLTVGNNI